MSFIHIITTEKKLETCSLSFFSKAKKGGKKYTVVENPMVILKNWIFRHFVLKGHWESLFQQSGQGRKKVVFLPSVFST